MTAQAPTLPIRSLPARRIAYGVLFSLLFAATVFEVARHGLWGAALAGGIGPDLALLLGAGAGLVKGQLHPRAVPAYNLVHRFWVPAALVTAASFGVVGFEFLIAGLAWATHVAMDRSVGYGLRTREGFQRAS